MRHNKAGRTALALALGAGLLQMGGGLRAFAEGAANLAELSLEELTSLKVETVFGASKFAQKTTEAPSSVTVISADEIKRYGYRTLADVLQSLQGFHVSHDRNYAFLGARGLSLGDFNARMLLLVDGHRVNNNLTDGAFLDTAFLLDTDLIDRVEVIRGPGSVLYGNNAFFGVINVVPRTGQQINGLEVSSEYGSFDAYKVRATYGKLFTNGMELLLSGSLSDSTGPDQLFYPEFASIKNNGIAEDLDDDNARSVFGSLTYHDFTLQGGFIRREKGNPTGQFTELPFTTFGDSHLRTIDERGYAALKFAHEFPDDLDVSARVAYDWSNYQIGYPYTLGSGTNVFLSEQADSGKWWGAELQLTKRLYDRHILTLGAEYRDDFHQEQRVTGQPVQLRDRQSYGVYAQADFEVRTNLHFNSGVRYDQYGEFDPAVNPRLALIYSPVEKTTLKALYGTAFRAPNFFESLDARFAIKPEEITSYELVLEQGIGQHLRGSVSGYYNEMRDLIVFESGNYRNFDAETRGTELAFEGSWASGIRGRLSYTLQQTENHSVGWDMPDSPNHLVKLNLSVPVIQEKLFASLEFLYTSDRQSLHNTTVAGQPQTVQGEVAGSSGIVNFTLFSRNLVKNLEVSASIYNLLDQSYSDPATRFHVQDTLARDGRTFRLKVTYLF